MHCISLSPYTHSSPFLTFLPPLPFFTTSLHSFLTLPSSSTSFSFPPLSTLSFPSPSFRLSVFPPTSLLISCHLTYICPQKKVSVCGGTTPVGAKCRVKGSATTFSGDSTSQVLQVACSTAGLLCLNANQTLYTTCDDYQIQFECDGWSPLYTWGQFHYDN